MIYILYGSEKILIDEFIKNEINKQKISNISKYDEETGNIKDIIEDASYMDLFSEEKGVIVNNIDFFDSKNDEENNILEKYLLSPNEKVHLFIIINKEKLDERKKIIKIAREKYKVLEFNKLKNYDVEKYIKNSFFNDGYNIDDNAVKKLINNIGNNISLLYKEIEKLKIYKLEEKEINEKDINDVVKKEAEEDIFKLVDAVLNNKKDLMFKYYKDLNEEPIKIIVMLAGEFRLLYQIKVLLEEGLNADLIASTLKVHPYRIKLGIQRSNNYKEDKILELIYKLHEIDYGIKSGELDKDIAVENFFLEI